MWKTAYQFWKATMEILKSNFPDRLPILSIANDVLLPTGFSEFPLNNNITKESFENQCPKFIGIIPKDPAASENFKEGDVGTIAVVLSLHTSNLVAFTHVTVFGQARFIVKEVIPGSPFNEAVISVHRDSYGNLDEEVINTLNKFKKFVFPLLTKVPAKYAPSLKVMLEKLPVSQTFDLIFSLMPTTFEEKLLILRTLNFEERLSKGIPILMNFLGFPKPEENKKSIAFIKLIRPGKDVVEYEDKDFTELSKKIQNANLPSHASEVVMKELTRMKRMSVMSPERAVLRNYLDFVADLPWSVSSPVTLDVNKAREELELDHSGMEKVKTRILEYLAVCQLKADLRGPILCFVGPPGVGKTSIGRSIARILNKKFHRISLGGLTNQSEIRGHRRTYIAALPGRILQALKQVGTNNPVILLDEIDKLGQGVLGTPRDALLEVLDPEQNAHFTDHYLGLPFDLSKVTFIATANSTSNIPLALADRMEIIHLSGYTPIEKFDIAVRHLLPKQLEKHGLDDKSLKLTDEAINSIICEYTREAGVRSLEQKLAAICRTAALKVAVSSLNSVPILIGKEDLEKILGAPQYSDDELYENQLQPGVAVGLCWTTEGGQVMTVEASRLPGTGKLILTGRLGNVMKESAQIALNWARAVSHQYGLADESCDLLHLTDLHIHFPAGAVSKEGPSAGITIACAILSLFTGIPLISGLTMTGEISLQGTVLPVGGLKEKLSAASRVGLRKVIVPFKSKNQLHGIPESILGSLKIILVKTMTEVVEIAFDGALNSSRNSDRVLCSKF